jgi:GNAT superfamily N-acetyltransferase
MNTIEIRLADKSEMYIGFSLLRDAALWLKEKDIDYWQNWMNPYDSSFNWIREGFDANQFYYVLKEAKIVGMFRLQWNDEQFWGVQEDNAGYIHSFTTDRRFYGQGLGLQILKLIEDMCKQNHKKYARLDCGAHIEALCTYYENAGYVSVGEVALGRYRLRLYEKELRD